MGSSRSGLIPDSLLLKSNYTCLCTLTIASERSSLSLQSDLSTTFFCLRSTTVRLPSPLVASRLPSPLDTMEEMKSQLSLVQDTSFHVRRSHSWHVKQWNQVEWVQWSATHFNFASLTPCGQQFIRNLVYGIQWSTGRNRHFINLKVSDIMPYQWASKE